ADGHVVAMVHGQITEEAMLPGAAIDARIDNGGIGRVDLRPANAVDRAAARIAGDGTDAPGVAVAILKVLRPEVVGLDRLAATLGHIDRHAGGHTGVGRQVYRADLCRRCAAEWVGPRPDGVGRAVVVGLDEEVVRAAGGPGAL